ncbi:MAG: adenylate/guanylate cyclase domain-containing protein [Rhodospirillales bacterium]
MKQTLQFNIMTIFIVLFLALSGSVAWYTYKKNSQAALELSDDIIRQVSAAAIEMAVNYLNPLQEATAITATLAAKRAAGEPAVSLTAYQLDVLKVYPQFYSLYAGYADGSFIQAINLPGILKTFGPAGRPVPKETRRVYRILDTNRPLPGDVWTYVDGKHASLASETAAEITYDPRTRPWYRGAEKNRGRFWTDLYVFTSLGKLGITASVPVNDAAGRFLGVVAADIALDELSEFLKAQKIGQRGIAFIVNRQKELVAFPDVSRSVKIENGKARPVSINEIDEAWIKDAAGRFFEQKKERFHFSSNGIEYIAAFTPFPDTFGKAWTIGIVVPLDDFIGTVKETNRHILIFSLIVLLIGVGLIGLISRLISGPIKSLAGEAEKIRDYEFDGRITVRSSVREVQDLSISMDTMKDAIRKLNKFVPKGLITELIESGEGLELGGRSRDITVLFTDIAGFTGISEAMSAEELTHHVSAYFEELTRIIRAHNGVIDKYMGDAVMAFWGAPLPNDDHTADACRAVLTAKQKVDELNERWQAEGKPPFHTRFGVNCGEAVAGTIGSSERMNYTVLGDTVNVASRLEGLNGYYRTGIIVSETVHDRVESDFLMRPVDIVAVKGRKAGIRVYELLAAASDASSDSPVPAATDRERRLRQATMDAFGAYLARDWNRAIGLYETLKRDFPGDGLSEVFINRCQTYKKSPPDESWQGVFERRKK